MDGIETALRIRRHYPALRVEDKRDLSLNGLLRSGVGTAPLTDQLTSTPHAAAPGHQQDRLGPAAPDALRRPGERVTFS